MATMKDNISFLRTPLADISPAFGQLDIQNVGQPQCKKFEMNYFTCLEAYGVEKGYEKCSDYFDDFFECRYRFKQTARANKIDKEREKKFKEGKIKSRFMEGPEMEALYKIED